jgi:hypothetical protein
MGEAGTAVAIIINRRGIEMIALLVPILLFAILAVITLGISFYCVELVLRLIARGLLSQQMPEPVRVQTASRAATGPLRTIRA